MKVLTFGPSPYILAKGGVLNRALLSELAKEHVLGSVCFDHDTALYIPDEDGNFSFTEDGNRIADLFPVPRTDRGADRVAILTYEAMKRFCPQVLITIGTPVETDFVYSIKQMYPQLFKWIAIVFVDATPLDDRRVPFLEFADRIICPSKTGVEAIKELGLQARYLPFGPLDNFRQSDVSFRSNDEFRIISLAKNSMACNPFAAIDAVVDCNDRNLTNDIPVRLKMHMNINDPGDYDINNIFERNLKYQKSIDLPSEYLSISDGVTDDRLGDFYRASHVFVDCPVRSAVGLSLLEAMSCRCVPIVTAVGSLLDIVSDLPEDCRYLVDSVPYVSGDGSVYRIADFYSISRYITKIRKIWQGEKEKWQYMIEECYKLSCRYSSKMFVNQIGKDVEEITKEGNALKVEVI